MRNIDRLRFAVVMLVFVVALDRTYAGTITGAIQLASSGKGVANGVLTFTLSQPAVASGSATIVTSPVNCYTDALGNVVGLPNPLSAASLSSNAGGGTLPAGNYFVRYTWANASGETVASPEVLRTTSQTGVLVVQAPGNPPANATQWKIYISASAGAETLQSTQNAPFSNYSQSTPVVAGAALPATNSSACTLRFNDELQPSYTGYNVSLTTATGAAVPGFPQKWYLNGGSAGTINLSGGLPLYSGMVVYPQPVLTNPANNGMQSINGPLNLNGFRLSDSNINGFFYVDGTTFTTVQSAITAACAAGGGTVFIPPGTYPQNSPFTLCSNLNLIGAGKAQADAGPCPTMITTTMTSGDLFPFSQMADGHMADFCIKNNAAAGANAAISLTSTQRVTAERLYIQGPFAIGIHLKSSSTATSSTIWNHFRDIHITGLATNGIGCLFDSSDAVAKVINNNDLFNVSCIGGTGGVGLKMTNSNNAQVINENIIASGELFAISGTGILITTAATRGVVFIDPNIEGSTTGFNKATGNTALLLGGNISSNTTNVSDALPSFTSFLNSNVGGVLQEFSVSPAGDLNVDGIGLNGAGVSNAINGVSGWNLDVSGIAKWDVFAGSFSPHVAGGADLGSATQPVGSLWLGNLATNNIKLSGTATAPRVATFQDATGTVPLIIAIGTSTLGNSSISGNTCNAAVTTAASNAVSSDTVSWSYATAPSSTTDGKLVLSSYVTVGNINFVLCNPTASALVPTGLVVNWRVIR